MTEVVADNSKPDPLKPPCQKCGATIDIWEQAYIRFRGGSFEHFPPCPKPPAPTVIEAILAKHRATPGGHGWSGMSCRECRTPHTDPCDVQELGHYIEELEAAARGVLAEWAGGWGAEDDAMYAAIVALQRCLEGDLLPRSVR